VEDDCSLEETRRSSSLEIAGGIGWRWCFHKQSVAFNWKALLKN